MCGAGCGSGRAGARRRGAAKTPALSKDHLRARDTPLILRCLVSPALAAPQPPRRVRAAAASQRARHKDAPILRGAVTCCRLAPSTFDRWLAAWTDGRAALRSAAQVALLERPGLYIGQRACRRRRQSLLLGLLVATCSRSHGLPPSMRVTATSPPLVVAGPCPGERNTRALRSAARTPTGTHWKQGSLSRSAVRSRGLRSVPPLRSLQGTSRSQQGRSPLLVHASTPAAGNKKTAVLVTGAAGKTGRQVLGLRLHRPIDGVARVWALRIPAPLAQDRVHKASRSGGRLRLLRSGQKQEIRESTIQTDRSTALSDSGWGHPRPGRTGQCDGRHRRPHHSNERSSSNKEKEHCKDACYEACGEEGSAGVQMETQREP
eukprot:scaffold3510_cov326-Prasinococcus_capsulatus_cf.AAC.4